MQDMFSYTGRDGAGDASTGREVAGHGAEDHVAASGRVLGISDRQMRRWRERYEEFGFRGLFDRRRGKPSPKRVPVSGGRESSGAVSREVFRSEPAAFSPARGAPGRDQLQLGEGTSQRAWKSRQSARDSHSLTVSATAGD